MSRWEAVATDRFDALGVKVGLEIRFALVLEADVTLLRQENARQVDLQQTRQQRSRAWRWTARLLELELDGSRVLRRDRVGHRMSDAKGVLLALPWKVDEERVRVAVYDLRTPFDPRLDRFHSLRGRPR